MRETITPFTGDQENYSPAEWFGFSVAEILDIAIDKAEPVLYTKGPREGRTQCSEARVVSAIEAILECGTLENYMGGVAWYKANGINYDAGSQAARAITRAVIPFISNALNIPQDYFTNKYEADGQNQVTSIVFDLLSLPNSDDMRRLHSEGASIVKVTFGDYNAYRFIGTYACGHALDTAVTSVRNTMEGHFTLCSDCAPSTGVYSREEIVKRILKGCHTVTASNRLYLRVDEKTRIVKPGIGRMQDNRFLKMEVALPVWAAVWIEQKHLDLLRHKFESVKGKDLLGEPFSNTESFAPPADEFITAKYEHLQANLEDELAKARVQFIKWANRNCKGFEGFRKIKEEDLV